jgi:hypothetical protein
VVRGDGSVCQIQGTGDPKVCQFANKASVKKDIVRLQITMGNAFWFVGVEEDEPRADVGSNPDAHLP